MQEFLTEDTGFLRPDPDITITDPGNAPLLLTISTYNHVTESLYIHSSRGFTATGQIKPDLAAPGVEVQGPGLPRQDGSTFSGSTREAISSSATSPLTRKTGSSVAAAIAAGAVASLFSWGFTQGNDLTLTSISVKSILIRGATEKKRSAIPTASGDMER